MRRVETLERLSCRTPADERASLVEVLKLTGSPHVVCKDWPARVIIPSTASWICVPVTLAIADVFRVSADSTI